MRNCVFIGGLLMSVAGPALADQPIFSNLHEDVSPEIIVSAPFVRDRFSLTTAASVLDGDALIRETRPTIGEMLARQPGVSASFFGPNASRPILRGQDAERVRVLTDGIGSFDVSNTSVDHAVAINPFLIERVEVVRGPAALLYGSNAIGGVVNVRDRRIPREVPDEPIHIEASGFYGAAAQERGGAGSVDVPMLRGADGSALVLHADGSYLQTSDYLTGGFVFAGPLRDTAAGGEAAEEALARGRVANSDARTWSLGGGVSWLQPGGGEIGFAVSHLASNYGIPNGLALEAAAETDIRLDMRQTRLDARALVPMAGAFEALKFRFGYAAYQHDELEDTGEIGTSFFNQSFEGRLELVQRKRGGWQGASGVQVFSRRFEALGEEAYIPRNLTTRTALFSLQEFELGAARLDVGGRWERSSVQSDQLLLKREFGTLSGSVGISVPLGSDFRLGVSASHAERAPSAEELFAKGAHAATRSVEIGNPDAGKEISNGLEAVLRGRGEGWRVEASAFYTRFRDFIYLTPTGDSEEGLAVFAYRQDGARFWGAEIDGAVTVARWGAAQIELTGLMDFTRAEILQGGGPLPRIPTLRFLGGVETNGGRLGGRLEVEHVTQQTRIAAFETATPGWTMVNASVNWRPFAAQDLVVISLSANNIFDVEARRHSSFLKNEAPLEGRDIRVSARLNF